MINKSFILTALKTSLVAAGMVLASGIVFEANAQRDPFAKPGWARTRTPGTGGARSGSGGGGKSGAGAVANLGTPPIEARIEYYKRLREAAAANGQSVPKVTSVLTLNEMSVTGIFRTPRGYAAMVEATPIKLSYTIYPGEKFFDGQLVAVEENRLVFRKVTKTGNGKLVASVENKPLRKYTTQDVVQGTAPAGAETTPTSGSGFQQAAAPDGKPVKEAPIVSPMDEINKQVPDSAKQKRSDKKGPGKPVKIAKN